MTISFAKRQTTPSRTAPLSIKANMLWNSAGSFTYMLAQWLTTVLVVRMSVGFDVAGIYTYVMSIYTIFSSVAEYRMYVYQVSDIHDEYKVGEYFVFKCLTSCISIVATMAYAFVTSEPSLWLPIFLYLIYKDLGLILDAFHAEEQKKERMDYIGISVGLQGIGSLMSFWIVFGITQNLNWTIFAMAIVTALIGVFYDLPRIRWFADFKLRISAGKVRKLLVCCFPGVIALVALAGSGSIPRQYLLTAMGESALGAYGTIAAPLAIIQACASYIFNPLLGYLTVAYEENDTRRFSRLMGLTVGGTILVGLACAVLLYFFGDMLYALIYGEEVLSYMYLIPLLIVSSVTMSFATFLNTLMVALRNFKATLVGGLLSLAVSLGTMVPFVWLFQLNGATLSLIAATVVSTLVMGLWLLKQLKEHGRN